MFNGKMYVRVILVYIAFPIGIALGAIAQSSAQQAQPSLYDRLGGLAPISVVVSDFIDAVVPGPPSQ